MKRILLIFAMTLCAVTAQAQVLVQTTVSINGSQSNSVAFTLTNQPTVGSVLLLATHHSQSGGARTITPPAGTWTLLDQATSGFATVSIWWHLVTVSDGLTYSFTVSGTAYWTSGVMYNFTQVAIVAPGSTQHSINTATSATFTSTAITPNVLGMQPVIFYGDGGGSNGGNTTSGITGWTKSSARTFFEQSYGYIDNTLTTDTTTPISGTLTTNGSIPGVIAQVIIGPGITATGCSSVKEGQTCTETFNKTVNVTLSGAGSLSCTTGCTSTVYTAPTNIGGFANVRNGCPVAPIDSIYSTRVDALPVNAQSATWNANLWTAEPTNLFSWTGGASGWGITNIDNTSHTSVMAWLQGGPSPTSTIPFPTPFQPTVRAEGGAFRTGNFSFDSHAQFLNTQTCDFYEDYALRLGYQARESGAAFNVTGANPYHMSNGNTGAVSGVEYQNTIPTLDDIKYGFKHPLDFAFLQLAPNSPGFPPTFFTNGYAWPADFSGLTPQPGYSNPPTGTLPGLGSWMRLSNAWCTANLPGIAAGNQYVLNVLTGMCDYGAILSDWTSGGGFGGHINTDVYLDPAAIAALKTASGIIGTAYSGGHNIEWIDQSSLSTCGVWWNCFDSSINLSNGFVTPTAYASFVADNGGVDTPVTVRLNLQPITVGTLHPALIIPAGSASYQLTWFVNGSANQGVTWTGTNVSSGGLFTVPATSTTIQQFDLTGASVVDSTAVVHVSVFVIPSNADGSVRMDLGSSTAVFNDGTNYWESDKFLPQHAQSPFYFTTLNWPAGTPDLTIWNTGVVEVSGDLDYGDFVVPPGTYTVTWMSNSNTGNASQLDSDGIHSVSDAGTRDYGQLLTSANLDVTGMMNFGLVNSTKQFLVATDQRYATPAVVGADRILNIRMHGQTQFKPDGTCCIGFQHQAVAEGVYIQPYVGSAHIEAHAVSDTHSINQAATLQFYIQDWGNGAGSSIAYTNDVNGVSTKITFSSDRSGGAVWSVLPGGVGGTINPTSGIYTAPSSLAVSGFETIQVTDSALGLSATTKILVNGTAAPALVN